MAEALISPPAHQKMHGRSTPIPTNDNSSLVSASLSLTTGRDDKKEDDTVSLSSKTTAVASNVNKTQHTLSTNKLRLASSSEARRMLRNRAREKSQNRVAGGAAAKLMAPDALLDSTPEFDVVKIASTDSSNVDFTIRDEKINEIRERAKEEWKKGKQENKYFFPSRSSDDDRETPVATPRELPSALNRQDIFHETADAALLSLLSPTKNFTVGSCFPAEEIQSPIANPLITAKIEKKVEGLKERMQDPSKTLSDLLTSICSRPDGEEMDRGYMVRRKNACGALKVLTSKPENRKTICWTVGVLTALTSVLEDAGGEGIEVAFPDNSIRVEYVEARRRAVSSILNLAKPKENRFAIFHSVGLVQALLNTINDDTEECRHSCCAILAYLARTNDNRLLMAHIPDFIDTLTDVIDPQADKDKDVGVVLSTRMASPASSISVPDGEVEFALVEDAAPEVAPIPTDTNGMSPSIPRRGAKVYDKHPNEHLNSARQYVFAIFSHLAKEKGNAFYLARHGNLIDLMVSISKFHNCVSHKHALAFLANLTRHKDNSKWLVFKLPDVVDAFVTATISPDQESKGFGCYGLQNFSQDRACRRELGKMQNVLKALCSRARSATDEGEKLSAISALRNLAEEPSNLVPMTNGPECVATLIQFACARGDGITETMQYRACDGLATLSQWLRKIATRGEKVIGGKEQRDPMALKSIIPTLKVVTWNQWN